MSTLQTQLIVQRPVRVFYSYSHRDEQYRDELGKHLAMLKRAGLIAEWHDRRIAPGDEWAHEIDGNLERADIILLLVSSDFLASDYCFDIELRRAMERHEAGEARVVPIIVRSVSWRSAPFGKLQALPTDGRPVDTWANVDAAWTNIAEGIQAVIDSLPPLSDTEGEEDDEDIELPTMLRGLVAEDPSELVLVVESGHERGRMIAPSPGDMLIIGRAEDADIHLGVEEGLGSRHHACIEVSAAGFAAHDLKSKNGTYVNGKRIRSRRLRRGDRVRCGETTLRLDEPPDPDRTLTVMVPRAMRNPGR